MAEATLNFKAPAKVNLYLYVLGRRHNGYHDLESLMAKISLSDRLSLSIGGGQHDQLTVSNHLPAPLGNDFTDSDNIILKAVRAFREKSGLSFGPARIHLEKHIPLGAGLGGGSSNAAAILSALNLRLQKPLSEEGLADLGLSLGADVPFFLNHRPLAMVTGVGEIFGDPPPEMEIWAGRPLLLLNPGIHLSTTGVYKNLGLTKGEPNTKLSGLVRPELGANSLYSSALDLTPRLGEIHEALARTKPEVFGMSGSGATFWAYYREASARQEAVTRLSASNADYWLKETEISGLLKR